MAASALQRSMRRALRWAVIAVVVGVIALYHIAAHHGAADTDHVAGAGASLETGHDAEPAAGVENLTSPAWWTSTGSLSGDQLRGVGADVTALGAVLWTMAEPSSGDSQHTQQLSSAVLTALLLLAAAVALFLSRRSHRVHGSHPAWQRCARRGRAPPLRAPSVPSRLSWLQVLVV